jgi:hypothetical protein
MLNLGEIVFVALLAQGDVNPLVPVVACQSAQAVANPSDQAVENQ